MDYTGEDIEEGSYSHSNSQTNSNSDYIPLIPTISWPKRTFELPKPPLNFKIPSFPPISLRIIVYVLASALLLFAIIHPAPRKAVTDIGNSLLSTSNSLQLIPDSGNQWPRAIPREFCGERWQKDYTEYHAAVLALGTEDESKYDHVWGNNPFATRGKKPENQKFVTFVCTSFNVANCGGTSDRVQGLTTAFLLALFSKRVFLIDFQNEVKAHDIFDAPHINWSYPMSNWTRNNKLNQGNLGRWEFNGITKGQREPFDCQIDGSLEKHWNIIFRSNRGYGYGMWDVPSIPEFLSGLGMSIHTTNVCAMDYILQPKDYLLQEMESIRQQIRDPQVFSIGIQIRVGDWAWKPDRNLTVLHPDYYAEYFTCAQRIHQRYGYGKRLLVFLVTDSFDLKQATRLWYDKMGNVTFLTTNIVPQHIEEGKPSRQVELQGYEGIIQDLWLLSTTSYKVVTANSGVGAIAAYRSYWRNPLTTVRIGTPGRSCEEDEPFVYFGAFAHAWSGG